MPIDHDYKMSIEAKPLYSSVGKSDNGGLVKIVRPLGSVRKAKFNSLQSKLSGINDSVELSELVTISDDQMSKNTETSNILNDSSTNEANVPKVNESLPPMSKPKNKIFESRYKIAASRTNSESVKPAKLYDKRVIYLPMFRINVQTYVANSEDNKAVENTRQSLKRMIDIGRQRAKSSGRRNAASLKSYNFMSPGKDGERSFLSTASPKRLVQTERSMVYTPKKSKSEKGDLDTKSSNNSTNYTEDKDRMDIRIESLELNSLDGSEVSVTELDNGSVESSIARRSLGSRLDQIKVKPKTSKENAYLTLSDPYRSTRDYQYRSGSQESQSPGWPTYEDFRKMRQKIRWQKNAQRQMERAAISGRNSKEVQKWVNIHYQRPTPVIKYTSQTSAKLNPIIVPSHTCVECPMCSMASKYEKNPTSVPPNSPTQDESENNIIQNAAYFPCQSDSKRNTNEPLTSSRSSQNCKSEVLMIPRVTVKVLETKEQLEEAKMAYTRAMT